MIPKIGDTIFVDDIDVTSGTFIEGGCASVSAVRTEGEAIYVRVAEVPGAEWRWSDHLETLQESLRSEAAAGKHMIRMNDGTRRPFPGD